ncbi:MAG: nitroreductase family protein [Xanthomonadales bacterium]
MKNPVDHPVQDFIANRWSPYAFDRQRDVAESDLRSLFEAARWSMSSYNAQPWRYIVGVRGRSQETWDRVFDCLVEGNRGWAEHAPVLALGLAEHLHPHNQKLNKAALHDLGAASAALTYEATARGIVVHQMVGIKPDRVREVFDLGESVEPLTALAIGYPAAPADADPAMVERDKRKRERRPVEAFVLHGGF